MPNEDPLIHSASGIEISRLKVMSCLFACRWQINSYWLKLKVTQGTTVFPAYPESSFVLPSQPLLSCSPHSITGLLPATCNVSIYPLIVPQPLMHPPFIYLFIYVLTYSFINPFIHLSAVVLNDDGCLM
jgi:hypothetical protein